MGTNEIATYLMIKAKTTYGSDSNEAPTKTEIKAISLYLVIANDASYGANELVKIDDISAMKEETRYTFNVTPTALSFTAAGGSKPFTVTSYKLTYLNDVAQGGTTTVGHNNSITGSGFSLSDDKVVASSNTGTSDRTGTVTVTLVATNETRTISLTQSGDSVSSHGDWVVTVSANPTTLSASGGTSAITATATRTVHWASGKNTTETATPSLSISGAGFTLSGKTVTASNNSSESPRSCTVTATHGSKSATCTITQNGKPHVPTTGYFLSVSPYTHNFSASGGSYSEVHIRSYKTSDGSYSASATWNVQTGYPDWITVSPSTGNDQAYVTLTAKSNPNESTRSGRVTFTNAGNSDYISVTQDAKAHTYTYVFKWDGSSTDTFTINNISKDGVTSGTISGFTSTRDGVFHGYSITGNTASSWFHPTASTTSTSISYRVDANTQTTMREGTITLKLNDSNKTLTIKVTQQPKEVEVSYIFKYSDSTTTKSMSFAAAATSGTVSIISETEPTHVSVPFTWTGKPDWVTITDGDPNTTIAVTKNTATDQRSATIIFHQTGSSKTLTLNISQTAGSGSYNIPFEFKNNSSRLFPAGTTVFFEKNGGGEQAVSTNTSLDSGASLGITRGWPDSDFPLRFVSNKISVPNGGPSNPSADANPSTVNTNTAKVTINLYGS